MTSEEMAVKVVEIDSRSKSNTRRIDKLEQTTDAIHSLATSVEILVQEQKHQTEAMADIKKDVGELGGKVDSLEKKPAKKWERIVDILLSLVVGAIAALVFSKIGLS